MVCSLKKAVARYLLLTKSRARNYRVYSVYWVKLWGSRDIANITVADLREWQSKRLKEVKPATVHVSMAVLSAVLVQAIEDGLITRNVVRELGWLKMNNGRTRWLTKSEALRMKAFLDADAWDYIEMLMNIGVRIGELLAIEWEDVSEEQLYVRPQKTGKGRWLPLNRIALAVLARRKGYSRPFPMSYNAIKHRFDLASQRAEVLGVTLHSTRHAYASMLAKKGVSLYKISKLLGHGDIKQTQRYSHLAMEDLSEAVRLLEE